MIPLRQLPVPSLRRVKILNITEVFHAMMILAKWIAVVLFLAGSGYGMATFIWHKRDNWILHLQMALWVAALIITLTLMIFT